MKRVGTVCFLIDNNKILLAQIEYPDGNKLWTGIGGFVEKGESPEQAVVREFDEETFIRININELIKIKLLHEENKIHVYKVIQWSGEMKAKDPSIKELRWFSSNNLPYSEMYKGNEEWIPELFK